MTKEEAGKYPGRDKALLYIILFIFIGGGIFFFWFSPWLTLVHSSYADNLKLIINKPHKDSLKTLLKLDTN